MSITAPIPVDELRGQAAQAEPGRALVTLISAIFVAIGWLAGRAITITVFGAIAVRYGYRLGRDRDPLTGRRPGEPAPAEASRPGKL